MRNRAFTLVELILIVAIVVVLASVAMVKYGPIFKSAYSAEAYSILANIATAQSTYYAEYDAYAGDGEWAKLDTFTAAPVSDNFTFTLGNTCATATPKTGKPTTSFYMSYTGEKRTSATCS